MLIRSRLAVSIGITVVVLLISSIFNYYVVNEFAGAVEETISARLRNERLLLQELSILDAIHVRVVEAAELGTVQDESSPKVIDEMANQFYDSIERLRVNDSVDQHALLDVAKSFQAYFVFSKRLVSELNDQEYSIASLLHFRKIQYKLTEVGLRNWTTA